MQKCSNQLHTKQRHLKMKLKTFFNIVFNPKGYQRECTNTAISESTLHSVASAGKEMWQREQEYKCSLPSCADKYSISQYISFYFSRVL